jgi:hypothetical protein
MVVHPRDSELATKHTTPQEVRIRPNFAICG